MKISNAVQYLTPAAGSLSFRSLSADEIEGLLRLFYLGFPFDERRARFGGAVSDGSIARYCRELPRREVVVIGCLAPDGLVAVAELHPYGDCMELALAGRDTIDTITIYGHVLQLAAFEAGRRGCRNLVMNLELARAEALDLVRGMGHMCVQDETATVQLGDYARLHALSLAQH
ncbi:hypothetical protein [Bradyrhizobium sp. MOS002]|uniref:hypothetical protein n=1 Tax=Bradyrhizobium sp. MOS002 TaxID=2133947 RepID=UPI000D1161DF|nr:hypothetical protein [Bradyrhizobium sp. MOS002]PSO20133.1 hypothetical protein C7G41_34850 [Bradyrhizobium sp. MOS002]